MAPLCADPRQVVISLNPARRQALLRLVDEIVDYMISQIETSADDLGALAPADIDDSDEHATSRHTKVSKDDDDDGRGSWQAAWQDDWDSPADAQRQKKEQKLTQQTQQQQKPSETESRQAQRVQRAAVKHIKDWRDEFRPKIADIVRVEDSDKIRAERQKRRDAMDKKRLDTPEHGEDLISFGGGGGQLTRADADDDVASLQALYHPIPTRLTTIPPEDRREALSCVLLLLLSTGKYSAHSRALVLYLASALELSQAFVNGQEAEIAHSLMENSTADKGRKETMSAEAEAAKRRQENKVSRFWKVGLASVAGAAVIGVTGGLAAPLVAGAIGGIMGGVGLGGVASFLGIFWMNGALVGALFGAYGAKMTGEMMDNYAKEVEDFRFIPLAEEWGEDCKPPPPASSSSSGDDGTRHRQTQQKQQDQRRLRVTIGINGWLNSEADVTRPWRVLGNDSSEVFALRYEMKTLLALGTALRDLVGSFAWKAFKAEVIKRTVLATLWAALWPIQVLAAASNVDNPFSRASNRSRKAGRLLADALANRVQGERPVTLVGYSLGAAAIHACLRDLAERHAFGLVADVVLIGAPAPSEPAHWRSLRPVVSGRIFNVYSENDMVLGFLYRMHSLALGVAGLQPIRGVRGLDNVDLSERVSGHLRYPDLTGEILRMCGFVGVRAARDIEKDDVIRMKDQAAEGNLVDFDDAPPPPPSSSAKRKESKVANDLHGLTISPPALSPSRDPDSPIPRRPVGASAASSSSKNDPPSEPQRPPSEAFNATPPPAALPTRRSNPQPKDDDFFATEPRLARRPVGAPPKQKTRQMTPDSTDPEDSDDDRPAGGITMVDMDDDDED
ncbi:hypothetical protein JDV02_009372 [Purpureocillium takamizusanense]|uniref:Transmembrane and coiled-coil domain-containing protein n=1 Tax=Purpureocillium takamizusanense TaxID=2060973 RepID=A0A9Q8QSA1_9HYPO|nr:uncharacterized protein JDV02_009372 [Purpureocillium takamizusanense]UNI23557.1 hypothetical protein JDV02_009372 [Purpureocillium takamizusanense]